MILRHARAPRYMPKHCDVLPCPADDCDGCGAYTVYDDCDGYAAYYVCTTCWWERHIGSADEAPLLVWDLAVALARLRGEL